jgi:two-component system chemotaxis sensor kinase CheA
VGLDVVAAAVRALGGTIAVRSRPGEGSAFLLDIPLTLAIVRSLIVEVDQERYAVPIAQVAATVRAEPQALHEINHRGVAVWRGGLIQVTDGGALLGTGARSDRGRRFYVVISSGGRRRGILVDRLIGHQDVVVKGLDPSLGRPDVVSGTTILGDGRVACILDPVRILEQRVPA